MKKTITTLPLVIAAGCQGPLRLEADISVYDLQNRLSQKPNPEKTPLPHYENPINFEAAHNLQDYISNYHTFHPGLEEPYYISPSKAALTALKEFYFEKLVPEDPLYPHYQNLKSFVKEIEKHLRIRGWEIEPRLSSDSIGIKLKKEFGLASDIISSK
jgi:hypothetical protein